MHLLACARCSAWLNLTLCKDQHRSSGVSVSAPPVDDNGVEALNKTALAMFCTCPKWDPWGVPSLAQCYLLWSGWLSCMRICVWLSLVSPSCQFS